MALRTGVQNVLSRSELHFIAPVGHCTDLEFGHPRCLCNNEVKYNEGQNTTKFIS